MTTCKNFAKSLITRNILQIKKMKNREDPWYLVFKKSYKNRLTNSTHAWSSPGKEETSQLKQIGTMHRAKCIVLIDYSPQVKTNGCKNNVLRRQMDAVPALHTSSEPHYWRGSEEIYNFDTKLTTLTSTLNGLYENSLSHSVNRETSRITTF